MLRTLNFSLVALSIFFSTGARAATHVVKVVNGGFVPATALIRAGDTVQFENVSTGTHTVTADPKLAANPANVALPEGAEPFDSGRLRPGDVFEHTFDVPGRYAYVCLPHERMGMKGAVVVLPAVEE